MPNKIMSINAGSSSLKFQLFEMPEEKLLVKGLFERLGGNDEAIFGYSTDSAKESTQLSISSHKEAVDFLLKFLIDKNILETLEELKGVGHRVAHGGEEFPKSCVIGIQEEQGIDKLCQLAPLHNPVNLVGIRAFKKALPDTPQVAVFDTSFHQTMPAKNYVYPIPYTYYEEEGIRKYGFHGTSHQFVAQEATKELGEKLTDLKIVSCHLGNGASICAIKNGQSFDTSMGFTPLAGLMMGTRCGDIDPSILTYLMKNKKMDADALEAMMNQQSGFLGVSGASNDSRDILKRASEGDTQSQLALDIFTNRVKTTIGAYAAEMGGIDVLIFTAGIGENAEKVREMCCSELDFLGIKLDAERNKSGDLFIQQDGKPVYVMVIPTNEELKIAQDTFELAK
ncbi:acetate kinase [Enterococcus sp. 669A]|uniref:Acetate kinase n=1 Tax=Candidatus Enterococcus moelleringii TaxID=2815325 RepID=A0ABS3LFK0_9ENTE|nr:acetate kinase [Enterococcus sp. 669A]MBO1308417.1 acetate kinase [Enterococcus sp. 669A]